MKGKEEKRENEGKREREKTKEVSERKSDE